MLTVYGIPNCDTIVKTLKWLNKNKIAYQFHNYKTDGIDTKTLEHWCQQKDWTVLLNKRSTTWKTLNVATQNKITNVTEAVKLMLQNNSIIKRPIITNNKTIVAVGFDENLLKELKPFK
ncbi:MAG: Spx/MgsR family RNA polymerase-binding regulatory protein [Bacteroidetes bacterium]|nr:Spx/MgsR family RNA polymerase-binding regulatory protein [Bacteroidota bacterium]MBS1648212.1 Spx/MgsR family RNA polymerase-binding regulatory protein [Bacteroidota bacterium]